MLKLRDIQRAPEAHAGKITVGDGNEALGISK